MMDIHNTLDAPAPKFHLGQKVTWKEGSKHSVTKEGVVVGMRYLSSLHRLASREKINQGDLGWRYEVSLIEGRSIDDLAQTWCGGDPLVVRTEAGMSGVAIGLIDPPLAPLLEEIPS